MLVAKFLLDVDAVRIPINSSALRNCLGGRLGCWSLELPGVKGGGGGFWLGCWLTGVEGKGGGFT